MGSYWLLVPVKGRKFVNISENTLLKRINRRLAKDGEKVCTSRSASAWSDVGLHYVINDRNAVVRCHVDLEQLGRELGVLRSNEGIDA